METMNPEADTSHRRMMWIAFATLLSMWVVMFAAATTMWYPWNPLTKLELAVLGTPRVGKILEVELNYCKQRDWASHEIRWSLVNDVTIVLPRESAFNLPLGCNSKNIILMLPQHIMPTDYKLQLEVIYEPWPWTELVYTRASQRFHVLPAQEQP